MTKTRIIITLVTIIVVVTFATIIGHYAKGYRFDPKSLKFLPNGILVIKSDPTAAQIFIDGELKTAADATIRLAPGTYDVSVRKEGYTTWEKRLVIEKEVVTSAEISLFRSAPSLTATTFSGVISPIATKDQAKIAYVVPLAKENGLEKAGLWVMETVNLPLGFSRDPRRITDGNIVDATWLWSPNGREILLTTSTGVFILDAGEFTPQGQRVNIGTARKKEILSEWETERQRKLNAKIKPLHEDLQNIFTTRVSSIDFSPDDDKILYTASSSATIPDNLIKPLPGASTQKQNRYIKRDSTYVYDIKEDRNFLIEESPKNKSVVWFATSNHILIAEDGKVLIADYDGTNRMDIYTGTYSNPNAFPTLNEDRILILTNLGAIDTIPNIYSLSLK